MGQKFKEVAHLRTDLDKYGEGYDRIFKKKDNAEIESHSTRESVEVEVEENIRIKNLARHSYIENSFEQGSEGFPESSSYIFGFMQGYKALEENLKVAESLIDELKKQDQIISKEIKTYMIIADNLRTVVEINQAENAKLRDALDKIDRSNDDMKYFNSDIHVIIHEVREELNELENK